MGLDWRPINRPKLGAEEEFETLFIALKTAVTGPEKIAELQRRLWEISITPYETLGAPQVGVDASATAWMEERIRAQGIGDDEIREKLSTMHGFYIVPLVDPCDGIPMYVTPRTAVEGEHIDTEAFRAKFLDDCKEFIGSLHAEAYESMMARDLADYGRRLMSATETFAFARGLLSLKDIREPQGEDGSAESAVHIAFSAAKWCLFWSERGHGLEADW